MMGGYAWLIIKSKSDAVCYLKQWKTNHTKQLTRKRVIPSDNLKSDSFKKPCNFFFILLQTKKLEALWLMPRACKSRSSMRRETGVPGESQRIGLRSTETQNLSSGKAREACVPSNWTRGIKRLKVSWLRTNQRHCAYQGRSDWLLAERDYFWVNDFLFVEARTCLSQVTQHYLFPCIGNAL